MPDPGLLRDAQDPATPGARLAEIAASNPELGAEIAANPACYPDLLDWLAAYGDSRTQAAVAARRAADAAPATAASAPAPEAAPAIVDPFADPARPAVPTPAASDPFGAPAGTVPASPGAAPAFGAPDAVGATGAPGAPGAKKRSKAPLVIALSVVGALVIGGGVAAAVVLPRVLPATSPDGAVDKFVHAVLGFDAVGIGTSLAPSEVAALSSSAQRLGEFELDPDEQKTAQEAAERLIASVTVTVDGLEYETDDIADGVQRVSIVEGTLEVDGDEDEIADAYIEVIRTYLEPQYDAWGYSSKEIDRMLDDMRDDLADQAHDQLPYELDFADVEDDLGFPISFISVQEGGGWYVSPLMTAADYVYQAYDNSDYYKPNDLGDRIPEPVVGKDAAEAAAQTLEAALDTRAGDDYWEQLAATLPLGERRLLAIYGPAIGDPWEAFTDNDYAFDLDSNDWELVDAAHAVPDDVSMSWGSGSGSGSEGSISFDHTCFDWETTSRYWDSYWDEYETYTDSADGCLDDLPIDLEKLGLDEPSLLAVQESGGWQLAVLGSLGEWSAIATEHLIQLSKDDELDTLVKNG